MKCEIGKKFNLCFFVVHIYLPILLVVDVYLPISRLIYVIIKHMVHNKIADPHTYL